MAYRRLATAEALPEGDALTSAMVGIGMRFAAAGARDPNVEDTLVAASIEGMERDDLRVLSILVTWIERHYAWINADRLWRAVETHREARVRALWAAIGRLLVKDRRFARLCKLHRGARVDLLKVGSEFQLRRHGEDERFAKGPLRVPKGTLRQRPADVLEPALLAKLHSGYRWRVIIGPSYRADNWAELERDPSLSAATLARRAYGSFATAWQVKKDWSVVHGASE